VSFIVTLLVGVGLTRKPKIIKDSNLIGIRKPNEMRISIPNWIMFLNKIRTPI
jgi:hypothetical protein